MIGDASYINDRMVCWMLIDWEFMYASIQDILSPKVLLVEQLKQQDILHCRLETDFNPTGGEIELYGTMDA